MQILSNPIYYICLKCTQITEIFASIKEIQVEEHDDDVRFKSGSGNIAVLCMRNASGHKYRNSLVIVDLAMGQIPRSTEPISCLKMHLSANRNRLSLTCLWLRD